MLSYKIKLYERLNKINKIIGALITATVASERHQGVHA